MAEHKHSGVESYAVNPGHVDFASGNIGKPVVESVAEGVPRNRVKPAMAIPLGPDGKPLGSEMLPPVPEASKLFASMMMRDLEGKK